MPRPITTRPVTPMFTATVGKVDSSKVLGTSTFHVSKGLFAGSKAPFVSHPDYLAMNLPAGPAQKLLGGLNAALKTKLKSRGDAHITVLTPPEVAVLKKTLSMKEIEAIASKAEMQSAAITPVGLGMGSVPKDETFFVVVKAPELQAIRQSIAAAFVAKGGDPKAFDAADYHSHVTIGFTSYDIQEEQGLIKDERSIPKRANPTTKGLIVDP